jgi:hypothetical protein
LVARKRSRSVVSAMKSLKLVRPVRAGSSIAPVCACQLTCSSEKSGVLS